MATLLVVGAPVAVVVLLDRSGIVEAVAPLLVIATALSLATSRLGAIVWASRRGSGDVVFGDLMVWGWLRRWRQERQLSSALRLLGLRSGSGEGPEELDRRERAQLLEKLGAALEARDPDTYGHSHRVARHAAGIARRMGLPRERVDRIRRAAAMHDVGKIETPVGILDKPGRLSAEEFAIVKRHAPVGATMVAGLGDEELAAIVRHHHERLDGGGYPDGLVGEEIPLGARIVAVADTFDAVTSTRPYRPAKRHREALDLLDAEAGSQLDPAAVHAFRGYYSGLRPLLFWAFAVNGSRQLLASLLDEVQFGQVTVAAKVLAATVLTVGAGDVAIHSLDSRQPASAVKAAPHRQGSASAGAPGTGEAGAGGAPGHSGKSGGEDDGALAVAPPAFGTGGHGPASPATGAPAGSGGGEQGGSTEASPAPESEAPGADGGAAAPAPSPPAASQAPAAPVSSTVESVVGAVESGSVNAPAVVPGLPEVQVNVPGLPSIVVGGK